MKYLDNETHIMRVSDDAALNLMESLGYITATGEPNVVTNLYKNGGERFTLTDEVVESEDDGLYLKLEKLDPNTIINVDESGRETVIETVEYDYDNYALNGVFEDEDGFLYAQLIVEGDEDEDDEDEDDESEESEEGAEEVEAEETKSDEEE